MKNKISDLRNHLFETLEALKDKENPMDIERAKAVASVAGVIVASAKVENDYMKLSGGTGFIEEPKLIGSNKTPMPAPRLVQK